MTPEEFSRLAPKFRGRISFDAPLAPYTWFRVGGPADALASPADEDDLCYLLTSLASHVPVTTLGVGSNIIVRDGGVRGVVIRLGGRAFGSTETRDDREVLAGSAVLDVNLARAAVAASLSGFAFLRGIPGSIGGALRMNAGAHGGEIKDIVVKAWGVDRSGALHSFDRDALGLTYRRSCAPADVIFTRALFRGEPGDCAIIEAEMDRVAAERERSQPIREKTGGSTFKNPVGGKAWSLIDAAGCRGLTVGGAQVSPKHCNFLLNLGSATAADIEDLGEEVRRRVLRTQGVDLHWEIVRLGEQEPRRS